MLGLEPRARSLLALALTGLALCFSVLAFATSYWCEGTHKVVKPPCLSAVRKGSCTVVSTNETSPANASADPNVVQYIWETGEDKYAFRYFHTGFWRSCEEHHGEEICRSFIKVPPESEKGVLWLSVASEALHIALLSVGFLLLCIEALPGGSALCGLKINAFAAVITVLSGLLGMVAHMMFMTVFQVAVNLGPKDWRPQTWYYGWSFGIAWLSFTLCMSASVLTLNTYTKTILEFQHRRRVGDRRAQQGPRPGLDPGLDLDLDLERLLWDKYIYSVSDGLDRRPAPTTVPAPTRPKGRPPAPYTGLVGSRSRGPGPEDDGEPC